jgi:uncharacterized protein (TIGR02466 family)
MLIDIFKTSIYKTEIKKPEYIKWFKKALAYEKKKNKPGVQISNVGGYQTTNYTGIHNQEINKEVFLRSAHDMCEELKPKQVFTVSLHSWWINENSFGNYNFLHNHYNDKRPSVLSGVYYIEAPINSGRLMFQNQDVTKVNDENNKYFDNEITWSKYFIVPKKYDLILFSPGTLHMVEPNMSKQKRISVSFNIQALPVEKKPTK